MRFIDFTDDRREGYSARERGAILRESSYRRCGAPGRSRR